MKPYSRYTAAIQVLLVVACLMYLFPKLDAGRFWQAWRQFDYSLIALVVAFSLVLYLVQGIRLGFLLGADVSLRQRAAASILGVGLNNLLPAKLGELAKVIYLKKVAGTDVARTLVAVFWERFLDVNMLLLIAIAASAGLAQAWLSVPLTAGVATLWIALILLRTQRERVDRLIALIPHARLRQFTGDAVGHVDTVPYSGYRIQLLIFTALMWFIYLLQILAIMLLIAEIPLSMPQAVAVFAVVAVSAAVPSTPGAVGVYEAAFVLALGWFGVDKEMALVTAILAHSIQLIPPTLCAFAVLALSSVKREDLYDDADLA